MTPCTIPADSRDESFSLVCPANCGSRIFIESTKLTPSQTSSGVSFKPRGTGLRNSQNSRTGCAGPALDRRNQIDVALGDAVLGLEHPGERPIEGSPVDVALAVEGLGRQPFTLAQFLCQILVQPARVEPFVALAGNLVGERDA